MKNKLQYKTARFISDLFIPPTFTLITVLFLSLWFEVETSRILYINLISVLFGAVFPILMFVIMRKRGRLADNDARIKEERTIPFIFGTLIYAAGLISLIYVEANSIILIYWTGYITNTILLIPINKYWKISVHAMGAAGPVGLLFFLFGLSSLPFLSVVLLVGWSRVVLKCHTPTQVFAGAMLGFLSIYFHLLILTNYVR